MKIALSKGSGSPKYELYAHWLLSIADDVEPVDLSREGYRELDRALATLEQCAGIIFTGGADIDPQYYAPSDEVERYRALCERIEPDRDEFELKLFEHAQKLRMPVLGICRGVQLINVALGGTLIPDIPTAKPERSIAHGKLADGSDAQHAIEVEAGTMLGKMLRTWDGEVNSAHHQALDRVAADLVVAAKSADGIVEAVEWGTPETRGFLLGVQWHPERMRDVTSPFARGIGERFVFECRCYAALVQGRTYNREHFITPPDAESSA